MVSSDSRLSNELLRVLHDVLHDVFLAHGASNRYGLSIDEPLPRGRIGYVSAQALNGIAI